ncbi:MAG: endonuclease/exonuclease/phosphatase family protein [Chloroflexota bacterium]|nr:endonuclease/exonuclease/phosphatase family protein [Chloroflexota bacterium]
MEQDDAAISIPQIVTVATMNVGNGMAPDAQLVKVAREMQPDILAFEELNRRQAEHLAEKLADIWPHQFSFGDGYEGRGIFSRLPLLRQEMLRITSDRPDGLVEVELDGQPLTIIVAHPRPPKLKGRTLEMSYSSYRQLLRLADLAMERSPAVLLGDFTVRPADGVYERLRKRGLVDAFTESGEGPERTFPVRVANEIRPFGRRTVKVKTLPVFRVDYIWHTPDIRSVATWVGTDTGSDHLPVMSRLAIPPKP